MKEETWHLLCAMAYALTGMALGIFMASSGNHAQHVPHAHMLLSGFVMSLLYAITLRLWLPKASAGLVSAQFWLHQAGTLVLSAGLLLLYGGVLAEAQIGPVLGIASLSVLIAAALMTWMLLRNR